MTKPLITYAAFCKDAQRVHPTTWISTVQATSLTRAKWVARRDCAADWQCKVADVAVLGIAEGDVTILEWED